VEIWEAGGGDMGGPGMVRDGNRVHNDVRGGTMYVEESDRLRDWTIRPGSHLGMRTLVICRDFRLRFMVVPSTSLSVKNSSNSEAFFW